MLSTLPADGISSAYRKLHTWLATPRCLDWGACPPANQHGQRAAVHDRGSSLPPLSSSPRLLSAFSAAHRWRPRLCRQRHRSRQHALERTPPGTIAAPRDRQGAPGEADVVVPDGTTVFDDDIPAVANLDPRLLRALRRAATDAAGDGIEFYVISGWRSRKRPGTTVP